MFLEPAPAKSKHTQNNMVCAKDDDETLCAINDIRPDAEQKRFSVNVRRHYTVGTLYEHVKLQSSFSDFELSLIDPVTNESLTLHDKQDEKLSDVGIKFGTNNTLYIKPRLSDLQYSTPPEYMSSDDDLALGASASPDESGNYNVPNPPALPPPLFDTQPSGGGGPSAKNMLLQEFNIDHDTMKRSSNPETSAYQRYNASVTPYTGGNSASGGSIISTNGFHHLGGGDTSHHNYRGLVNQAMTCYLNSLLQALYMTPEFRNALYNWEFDGENESKSIPYQLQRLFVNLQTSPKSAVETTDLTRSFGWDSAEGWQQHDIQELCRVMFDALEHKFRNTKQADLINRLYEGRMIDYVKCLNCNTEKQREDKFLDIPLPVRPFGSQVANECVEEALQGFVKPEILNESNQYFCDTCKKKCDAHKGLKFTKFPYILTLHLKRFDFDYQSFHRIKLNDKVSFPELLNLNDFVNSSSESASDIKLTTSTIAAAAAAAEAAAANTNGNGAGPMMMETAENFMKSDECSTTDSGSALEEDSFQNGGTSVSSTTTTPNDQFMVQDDDEGIDMESGSNGNSKSSPLNNSFNAPGPYKYELFAIMIHSGSASGGHYYAYIKDFKNGRWYSFNDQTVQPITQEDIHKSFGGGSYKTSYTGAYTSSTNAYMLMYRQIDVEKNTLPISEEEFPEHIKRLVTKIRDHEGNPSRDQVDMTRLRVAYENPHTRSVKLQRLALFNYCTLAETLQEALRVHHLKGVVPVERCRLVGYDSKTHTIERSFDGQEETLTIDDAMLQLKHCDGLLLEVREDGEIFEEYLPEGVMTKVYKVDAAARDVEGPFSIRANFAQTIAQYKAVIARKLKLNPKSLLVGKTVHNGSAKLLTNEESKLADEGFIEYCKVFVATVPAHQGDDAATAAVATEQHNSRFLQFIQRLDHLVALYMVLPNLEKETLDSFAIPRLSKETLACLAETDGPNSSGSGTACGDSNSEDSSLSDNDRTLVDDDFVHNKLNGDLHLANGNGGVLVNGTTNGISNGSNGTATPTTNIATTTGASNGGSAKINGLKHRYDDDDDDDDVDEEEDEDAKLMQNLQECRAQEYYFKVTPLGTATGSNNATTTNGNGSATDDCTRSTNNGSGDTDKHIQILIDKRSSHAYLKYRLQAVLQIPMEYFKVSSASNLCTTSESLLKELEFKDDERLAIDPGRVLRKGEHKLHVSYVNVKEMTEEMDKAPFLCTRVVKNGQLVGQVKADILAHLAVTLGENNKYSHLHMNNCRLRRKGMKYPSAVYLDDERIGKEVTLMSLGDVFLQEVEDLQSVTPTGINDVVLLLRRWYPSERKLGQFQEILYTDKVELKQHLSNISGIPVENIEYVKMTPTSQHRDNVLNIPGLNWVSTPHSAAEDSTIFPSGTLLYYCDRTEPLKELTADERKELAKKDNRTGSTYSPRKERALKIYLDASPKKVDD